MKISLQVKRLIFVFMSKAYIYLNIYVSYSYIGVMLHSQSSTISIPDTYLSMTHTCLATIKEGSTYLIMFNVPLFSSFISFQIPLLKYTMPS